MKLELAVVVVTVLSLTALLPGIMSTIMRGRGWGMGRLGDVKSIDTHGQIGVKTRAFRKDKRSISQAVTCSWFGSVVFLDMLV